MRQSRQHYRSLILALTLAVPAAWAQQRSDPGANTPDGRVAPLSSSESSNQSKPPAESNTTQDSASDTKPDTRPLTGAERYSLGSTGRARSYFMPSFQLMESADTNPTLLSGVSSTTLRSVTTISGQLALQRIWSRYQFNADLSAGGVFYNNNSGLNSTYEQFALSQEVNGRRWSLLFGNNFSYLPDSGYGYGGGLGSPLAYGPSSIGLGSGTLFNNINPGLVPSQSVYTTRARRFNDGMFGEVDYKISPRASITVIGNFGFLRFLDPGYLNSKNYSFQAGYNYNFTPKDTLGVDFGMTFFRYDSPVAVNNFNGQSVRVSYGRRITGRLAFQIAGGPQFNRTAGLTTGSSTAFSWNLMSSLLYHLKSGNLNLSYNHYTTSGSGVYFGTNSDEVRFTDTILLSRKWTASLSVAYNKNTAIQFALVPSTNPAAFQTWNFGGSLSRPVGRHASVVFNYSAQRQYQGTCASSACVSDLLRHVFGVGFNFNFRPLNLD
jgi:hypothetical protein